MIGVVRSKLDNTKVLTTYNSTYQLQAYNNLSCPPTRYILYVCAHDNACYRHLQLASHLSIAGDGAAWRVSVGIAAFCKGDVPAGSDKSI